MSYIETRCPNGCKYKSGGACVASECPYQTGNVKYDIRLNAEDKTTKNKQAKIDVLNKLKEKLHDIIDFLYTHNKNYTKKQWDCIIELKEIVEEGSAEK